METIRSALSTQTALNHTLSRIADTTKIGFQISKQIVVAGGQVITVCSLLGNHRLVDWTAVPDLRQGAWGLLAPGLPYIRGTHITSYKCCLAFHQHTAYHKLLTFRQNLYIGLNFTDNVN